MADFSRNIKIKASQADASLRLRPSSLLTLLQEISIEHTEILGYPRETTLDKGLLWVVAKERIEIKRMPKYDESIELITYSSKTMHVLFPRSYLLKDDKGDTVVEASAVWALIDVKSRKIVNPSEHHIDIPDLSEGRSFLFPLGAKMPVSFSSKAEIKAAYSLCDLNKHLNNAYYLDIAEDLLPISYLLEHEVKSIEIEYLHEVKLGESLLIDYEKVGDDCYFFSPAFKLKLSFR